MSSEENLPAVNCQLPTVNCPRRPTWAEVDFGALLHNYRTLNNLLTSDCRLQIADCTLEKEDVTSICNLKSAICNPRLIPVVKADAYGHGAVPVARTLAAAGATAFAVALVEEGTALRAAGISQEILILEGAWPGQEEELVRSRLTAAVYSTGNIRRLEEAARRIGLPVRAHLKIDTGMGRLGAPWDGMGPTIQALLGTASLRLTGTFSHLASAEEEDATYTEEQVRRLGRAAEQLRQAGLDPGEIHLANSAGLLHHPQMRGCSARPGIALYGYPPASERCPLPFRPVLTLKTRVGRIHTIPAGESVGYNRRFFASRATRTATLPIGYADGYRRDLTGRGRVIIRNQWADVIGAISMDMIVADVTDLPDVREGEEVVLLGRTPDCRFDAENWAALLGTIPYEILCGLGSRIPRIYKEACPAFGYFSETRSAPRPYYQGGEVDP